MLALPVHAQAPRPFDYFDAGQFMEFTNNINNLKNFRLTGSRPSLPRGVNCSSTPGLRRRYWQATDSLVKTSPRAATVPELFQLDASPTGYLEQIRDELGRFGPMAGHEPEYQGLLLFLAREQDRTGWAKPFRRSSIGVTLATAQGLEKPGLQSLLNS